MNFLFNFANMKCLVMVRASTEAQKIEDQHNEMVRFCNDEGYDELVFVEDKGASAIKLARRYKGHRWWWFTKDGSERPLYAVRKIVREPMGKKHPRAFKKIKDW